MNFKQYLIKEGFFEPAEITAKTPIKVKVDEEIKTHLIQGNWHKWAYEDFENLHIGDVIEITKIVDVNPPGSYNYKQELLKTKSSVWVTVEYRFLSFVEPPINNSIYTNKYKGYISSDVLNNLK